MSLSVFTKRITVMNNSDFNFRKPLSFKKCNLNLSQDLKRINTIGQSNFSPVSESLLGNRGKSSGSKIMAWVTAATIVVGTITGAIAGIAALYNSVKDFFAGRREMKVEVERLKKQRASDGGAKEFFDWLPKSKTFAGMQKAIKNSELNGNQSDSKIQQTTDLFIKEVKESRLSKNAIFFIAKELNIKPEYLQSGVRAGSSSAVLSGVGARPEMESINHKNLNLKETRLSALIASSLSSPEKEILMYTTGSRDIYRSRITSIINNYKRKISGGKFERDLAIKGFVYAVEDGIKEYNKKFSSSPITLNPTSRLKVAAQLLAYYGDEIGIDHDNTSYVK